MKKILFIVLAILFLSVSSFAENEEVVVAVPEFDVSVNGQIIDIEHSQYPVISYKNITYFPMTSDYLSGIGLGLKFTSAEGLKIDVKDEVGTFNQNFLGTSNILGSQHKAILAPFHIEVNGKVINNDAEEYPVLLYKNITYFPMTWRFAVEEFGWKTSWSEELGFGIKVGNTVTEVSSNTTIVATQPQQKIKTATEIGELADAVVKITVVSYDNSNSTGSGFFYNNSGSLITNYHVIDNAKSINIMLNDESVYSGDITILGYDEEEDIAIIDTTISNNLYIELGDSDTAKLGNSIYVIGSPFGLLNTLSTGVVSSVRKDDIQISAPISHGSSGGVLLNDYGVAIGVTYAGYVEGENLGFAIPINKVKLLDMSNSFTLVELFFNQVSFRNNVWGSTMSAVIANEGTPSASDEEGLLYIDKNVIGYESYLMFMFQNGYLYGGAYSIIDNYIDDSYHILDFGTLKEALTNKYGSPYSDDVIWYDNLWRDDYSNWKYALLMGDLKLLSTWKVGTTEIALSLSGKDYEIEFLLLYIDRNVSN